MEDTHRTAELRRKLDKDPGSRLFAQLAEELRKEGRHEEAIGVARKGLEKNPNYPSARLTLARSLLDSGRPGEARPELEQIVKASPDNILASRLLGDALQDLGDYPQALAQFEKTLRLSPGDKMLVDRIAMLKSRDQAAPAAASAPPPATFPSVPGIAASGGGTARSRAFLRSPFPKRRSPRSRSPRLRFPPRSCPRRLRPRSSSPRCPSRRRRPPRSKCQGGGRRGSRPRPGVRHLEPRRPDGVRADALRSRRRLESRRRSAAERCARGGRSALCPPRRVAGGAGSLGGAPLGRGAHCWPTTTSALRPFPSPA